MNYYDILGITKSASQDEIKKAYKKLVMQHHPDRGGNEDDFKKVTEAYEILKDPAKRHEYDNPPQQHNFNSQHFNNGFNPFDQFFSQFQQAVRRNRNLAVRVTVDLKDMLQDKAMVVQYRLQSGKIEYVNVTIPAGTRHGDTIQYRGLGDDSIPGLPRGDLHITIKVVNPDNWFVDDNNLVTRQSVNVFDILTGCAIMIETLDGKHIKLNIPKGTKPGTIMNIPEYGLPNVHTGKRGNVLVQINVDIPRISDPDILSKIEDLKKEIKERE